MPERSNLKTAFLTDHGWQDAHVRLVAGDASNRKYERLTRSDDTRILMDAPPDKGEDIRPFVRVARLLQDAGLSAPTVFAQDEVNGFLLLEDFGDNVFARLIADDPDLERPLYEAAVDVLVQLHAFPAPSTLARYDATAMAEMACLAFDWYLRGTAGDVDVHGRSRFYEAIHTELAVLSTTPSVVVQRDYHAENLIWLPDRSGPRRVGLLDFQDAMLGHPAYDLVSVLKDARRDVSLTVQAAMIDRYIAGTGVDAEPFKSAYTLLGIQRNMRILGVFARLSLAYGKTHYVDLVPRVWGHIVADLSSPQFSDLAPLVLDALPPPTPDVLQTLKDKCKSIPLPS